MSLLLRLVDALNQDDGQSRRLNVLMAVGMGVMTHALAWMNAVVWLCLLALLGGARWMLNSYTIIGVSTARTMVTVLIMYSLLWPFYSLPVVASAITLTANVILTALTIATIVVVRRRSVEAGSLIMPLTVWLVFAIIVNLAALGWV
jgi:hypothetical protein